MRVRGDKLWDGWGVWGGGGVKAAQLNHVEATELIVTASRGVRTVVLWFSQPHESYRHRYLVNLKRHWDYDAPMHTPDSWIPGNCSWPYAYLLVLLA